MFIEGRRGDSEVTARYLAVTSAGSRKAARLQPRREPESSEASSSRKQSDRRQSDIPFPNRNVPFPTRNISSPNRNISFPNTSIAFPIRSISFPNRSISCPSRVALVRAMSPLRNLGQPHKSHTICSGAIGQPDPGVNQRRTPPPFGGVFVLGRFF